MEAYAFEIAGESENLAGNPISKIDAIQFVKNYKTVHNPNGDETIYVGFSKSKFDELLAANPLADGLRIYLARKNGSETIICVLTKTTPTGCTVELELGSGIAGLDFGTLCPPGCSCDCDPNSLARQVYKDLICPPPAPQP